MLVPGGELERMLEGPRWRTLLETTKRMEGLPLGEMTAGYLAALYTNQVVYTARSFCNSTKGDCLAYLVRHFKELEKNKTMARQKLDFLSPYSSEVVRKHSARLDQALHAAAEACDRNGRSQTLIQAQSSLTPFQAPASFTSQQPLNSPQPMHILDSTKPVQKINTTQPQPCLQDEKDGRPLRPLVLLADDNEQKDDLICLDQLPRSIVFARRADVCPPPPNGCDNRGSETPTKVFLDGESQDDKTFPVPESPPPSLTSQPEGCRSKDDMGREARIKLAQPSQGLAQDELSRPMDVEQALPCRGSAQNFDDEQAQVSFDWTKVNNKNQGRSQDQKADDQDQEIVCQSHAKVEANSVTVKCLNNVCLSFPPQTVAIREGNLSIAQNFGNFRTLKLWKWDGFAPPWTPCYDRVKQMDLKGSSSGTKGHANNSGHPNIDENGVICQGSPSKTSGCVHRIETNLQIGNYLIETTPRPSIESLADWAATWT